MKTLDLFNSDPVNGLSNNLKDNIKRHSITEHLSLIEINIDTQQEDLAIKLNDDDKVYLHFMYNLKDSISFKSMVNDHEKKLSQFQSAIVHDKSGYDTFLKVEANRHCRVYMVQLSKYDASKNVNSLFSQFEKVFDAMSNKHYFMHTGIPDLQVGEYVKKLMEMPKTTLSERLMAAGYINILLGLKLKLYLNYTENPIPTSNLTKYEIDRIKKISDTINNSPELNYNIENLCRECGISAAKLQLGFKEMHGKTVCNYISQVRLEKAEELLKNTDLNVSEIVYSLGWTSRSYFCKIFKEKYQCSPKHYQTLMVRAV